MEFLRSRLEKLAKLKVKIFADMQKSLKDKDKPLNLYSLCFLYLVVIVLPPIVWCSHRGVERLSYRNAIFPFDESLKSYELVLNPQRKRVLVA